jgi:hypothetical protein
MLEEVYKKLYPLLPFIDAAKFKPFADLEKKFLEVTEPKSTKIQKKADELFGEDLAKTSSPKRLKERKAKEETQTPVAPWKTDEQEQTVTMESDDSLDYYSSLVNAE